MSFVNYVVVLTFLFRMYVQARFWRLFNLTSSDLAAWLQLIHA